MITLLHIPQIIPCVPLSVCAESRCLHVLLTFVPNKTSGTLALHIVGTRVVSIKLTGERRTRLRNKTMLPQRLQ